MWQIELENVGKVYNPGLFKKKVVAVKSLSLTIGQGEVFGLIGPNGAGKSTTIRMILGMVRPSQGRIRFSDNFSRSSDFRQEIGYLPENPYLYDHLNLLELLSFCGRASGMEKKDIVSRGNGLIERLGLARDSKRPLRTFSKGMLQRAGICFALLHNPSLVILDEPMSGLDPVGRKMVFDLVCQLKEEGNTIFFCSHILNDVERLCDRIGIMVNGEMVNALNKEQFAGNSGGALQLVLSSLSSDGKGRLSPYLNDISSAKDQDVLVVDPRQLASVYHILDELGIEPCQIKSEAPCLEKLFLQAVEEATHAK